MARRIKVAAVEFPGRLTELEPGPASRDQVLKWLDTVRRQCSGFPTDLYVLSESVEAAAQRPDMAEAVDRPGPLLNAYRDWARDLQCHIAGSVKLAEDGAVYNAVVFVAPDGRILGDYRKSNLTIGELEAGLTPGKGAKTTDTDIGRLGGVICFDLNYLWLMQEYRALKPDILCYPSAYHGGIMQAQWAYQCRCFFVSALWFHGSGVLDPFGRPLRLTDCYTSIARAEINLDRVMVHLDYNRDKFADMERKYRDEIRIEIPANIGSALIYSESAARSAEDLMREFGLECLDDYLARSRRANERA